jgi:glutamine synthetase
VADAPARSLTRGELEQAAAAGAIDTVVVALPDMYGRLVGKRADAAYFLSHADDGIDHCNSLLALDMESDPTPGYTIANIEDGYGDSLLLPDLRTLRRLPWHEATALVLCDAAWFDRSPVAPAPRATLARQVERARALGLEPVFASELEFYVCRETYAEAFASDYARLTTTARYNTDSHLLSPGFEEPLLSTLRRMMRGAGLPVVASKAEAWPGQHEIVFAHGDPVTVADHHVVFKHGAKEIADQRGCSITFMAKPFADWVGSSCHAHMSLWRDGQNAFTGETELFHRFLAGQLACAAELAVFLAPTVNSYKRFVADSWAGTTLTWAHDNRTTGFRAVGRGSAFRCEARIPGADANPYLVFAALLAAGLHGIEHELEPPEPFEGNAYAADLPRFPSTLREAIRALEQGTMARAAFGDDVVDHYLNFARAEQRYFDAVVTDYERARMFERG